MSDAVDEWIVVNGMGGFVCGECGMPVESEPCEAHQPMKYARAHGNLRVPVSLFERVAGCFACENRAGLPIPVSEFPAGGEIGLCTRHWNWWLIRFAHLAPDREPPRPPCAAHLLACPTCDAPEPTHKPTCAVVHGRSPQEHDPRCISRTDSEFRDVCDCKTFRMIDAAQGPSERVSGDV